MLLVLKQQNPIGETRMNCHSIEKTNPRSRALIVERVQAEGWSRRKAAEALGLSVQVRGQVAEALSGGGRGGALDRSSRPRFLTHGYFGDS